MFLLLSLLVLGLLSCAQNPEQTEPANQNSADVALNRTEYEPTADGTLDIGIRVFDVQPSENADLGIGDWIVSDILDIERQYLPSVLRNTLVESNRWGAVRVLPRDDPSVDLSISGSIVRSDGIALELDIRAIDSSGLIWIDKSYVHSISQEAFATQSQRRGADLYSTRYRDPFQSLYNQIVNDLSEVLGMLDGNQLEGIRRLSHLRYASDLSPESFDELLRPAPDGTLALERLPADNDPMLARVGKMKTRHHIFIDTLDQYYITLHREMQPVYDIWRRYSREQISELRAEAIRAKKQEKVNGGFSAISNSYHRYKSNRIFEQEWAELASGFTGELAPKILELNRQVYGLTGSVDQQYQQWRKILREFYRRERGL